jgi:two-component system sensor histidine kinase KdpD
MAAHDNLPSRDSTPVISAAEYVRAIGAVLLTTLVALALRTRLAPIDVAMLYLLAVVFVAARYRQAPAILTSILSIALFDFLFVPPYYTFNVEDSRFFLTFAVMLVVALTMTRLTARIRDPALAAQAGERRTAALYAMDRELRGAATRSAVVAVATPHLGRAVSGEAAIALVDEPPAPGVPPAWPTEGVFDSMPVRVTASWAYERGESAGSGTHHGAETEALVVPLTTPDRTLGVVAVRPEPPGRTIDEDERRTVEALAELLAAELARPAWAERGRDLAR